MNKMIISLIFHRVKYVSCKYKYDTLLFVSDDDEWYTYSTARNTAYCINMRMV